MPEQLSIAQLTGQTDSHLTTLAGEQAKLHPLAAEAYLKMRAAAEDAGISLAIASGFRSLQRQLSIWNRKWQGQQSVLDKNGQPLTVTALESAALMHAILHWSALPGASRHHWGSDFDVFDPRPFRDGSNTLQLVPSEYCDPSGPCFDVWQWLTEHAHEFGFFFPYARYQGGVAQEPWHLSYRPLATQLQQQLSLTVLTELLQSLPLEGKTTVLEQLPHIQKQYINNISEDSGWTNTWCGYSSF